MKSKNTLLFVFIFMMSTNTQAQDLLAESSIFFGNYDFKSGKGVSIGRSENNLFFMEYGLPTYHALTKTKFGHFSIEDSNDSIQFTDAQHFILYRANKKIEASKRPTYSTEEITCNNVDIQLQGTLWKPLGKSRFPVIILVHGSGPETRYGMRYLPYYFTSLGYGVLTYDKRGSGLSTGKYEPWFAGIKVLADDAVTWFNLLHARADVDQKRIGMMGISNGAWVITKAAAQLPDIDFIIPVVGSFVPIYKQELYRLSNEAKHAGLTDASIANMKQIVGKIYSDSLFNFMSDEQAIQQIGILMDQAKDKDWFSLTALPQFETLPGSVRLQLGRAAWNNELSYDPLNDLRKLKCPILVVLGELDKLSPTATILHIINKYRNEMQSVNLKTVVLPKTSHFIIKNNIEGKIAPEYLKTLKYWLSTH